MDRADRIGREDEGRPGARLKEVLELLSEEARDFARRKPLEAVLLSFLTGIVIGGILRRDR